MLGRGGVYTYVAELSSKSDTRPENNTASSVVLVSGQPKILLIRNRNEPLPSALPGALRAQGLDVSQMSPADAPKTEAGLSGYDSIILSDVADGDLSPRQITAIAEANQNFGVGLGMMGGINSFAAGGYVGTPIEDALPVLMTPKSRKEIPGADVVIVLDASGSMSADENGLEKVEIAARAALNLLSALQPQDRVAVLAVTETASIVMPLVTPAEAAHYVPSIESVDAGGGGIDCRNGLEAAYTMLQTSDAEIKHVIICPDTTDSEQQEGCVALATAVYKEAKISTSVCGIGQWTDSDVPFQRSLAKAGHGQLFVANQAGNLPQFFKRDVQSTKEKLFAEGVFGVIEKVSDPVLSGLSGQPAILGYNLVTAKPGASTPVVLSGDSDPLVAYWRNGSGKSFAFTSDDDAHWAQRWLGWPGYPPFWSKLVRWSRRSSDDQSFQTSVSNVNGVGHIVVDAYSSAGYSTTGAFKASIAEPDGALKQAILAETAPGRYESDFDSTEIGAYLIQVHNVNSGGGQMASISTSYSPEYSDVPPNVLLLAQIAKQTAGMMLTSPRQAFRPSSSPYTNSKSLANVLLILASVLFVLDVAWRRFGWRITQQSVRDTAGVAAEGAIAAAGSISRSITPKPLDSAAFIRAPIKPGSVEGELLRSRTAGRADMDDDNPFPYVASLPPRPRKESIEIEKKEEE